MGEAEFFGVVGHYFGERSEEMVGGAEDEVEIERFEYVCFHTQQISLGECACGETDQLVGLWDLVGLLILCSYEERSGTQQLQLVLPHRFQREVLVDNGCHDKQRLREHLEFEMHVHDPVQQDSAHGLGDFGEARLSEGGAVLLRQHEAERLVEVVRERFSEFLLSLLLEARLLDLLGDVGVDAVSALVGWALLLVEAETPECGFVLAEVVLEGLVVNVGDFPAEQSFQRLHLRTIIDYIFNSYYSFSLFRLWPASH